MMPAIRVSTHMHKLGAPRAECQIGLDRSRELAHSMSVQSISSRKLMDTEGSVHITAASSFLSVLRFSGGLFEFSIRSHLHEIIDSMWSRGALQGRAACRKRIDASDIMNSACILPCALCC